MHADAATDQLDYVAICPECHNMVGWLSATLPTKDRAKVVAKWIRLDLSVERMSTEDAKRYPWKHAVGCSEGAR